MSLKIHESKPTLSYLKLPLRNGENYGVAWGQSHLRLLTLSRRKQIPPEIHTTEIASLPAYTIYIPLYWRIVNNCYNYNSSAENY